MAIFNFLKQLFSSKPVEPQRVNTPQSAPSHQKLSFAEKELIAVQRTTLQDLQQLHNFPFVWNAQLQKHIQRNSHPFAYMDIVGSNIPTAISELEKMNAHISHSKLLCKKIPKSIQIPTSDIVFRQSNTRGYSRLICSPVSYLGEPTETPVTLSFMTDLERNDTTHGELCYGQDGNIRKASLYFWRKGNGYFFYYETVKGLLTLSRIESTNSSNEKGIIYKGAHILDLEAKRAQEEKDFAWIQQNVPDKCPKNITGYRRMKTQNTKNYQILKRLAAEKGREI